MNTKLISTYQDLCDYLTVDPKKCPLSDFFTDLKTFCTVFLTCLQENRLWREQEDKAQRAKQSKQLVDEIRKTHRSEAKAEPKAYFKPSKISPKFIFSIKGMLSANSL